MTDPESIQKGFPHPNVDPVHGKATYKSISDVQRQINLNAANMHLNLGKGKFGLLILSLTPSVYLKQAEMTFISPVNPDATAVMGGGLTDPQISAIDLHYKAEKAAWLSWISTDKALKGQLVSAVDNMY